MKKALRLGVIGIDHGHIFDMLDEMIKEGCSCNSVSYTHLRAHET